MGCERGFRSEKYDGEASFREWKRECDAIFWGGVRFEEKGG